MIHVEMRFDGDQRTLDVYTSGPHAATGIVLDALLEASEDLLKIVIDPNSPGPPTRGIVVEQMTP